MKSTNNSRYIPALLAGLMLLTGVSLQGCFSGSPGRDDPNRNLEKITGEYTAQLGEAPFAPAFCERSSRILFN